MVYWVMLEEFPTVSDAAFIWHVRFQCGAEIVVRNENMQGILCAGINP